MADCVRCGATLGDDAPHPDLSEYEYCRECWDKFSEVKENGVFIRSRHGHRTFEQWPYEVSGVAGPSSSQVEALAQGVDVAEKNGTRAVFCYQPTGSHWFVGEYLAAHPSIAKAVEKKRQSASPSPLKTLLAKVTSRLH